MTYEAYAICPLPDALASAPRRVSDSNPLIVYLSFFNASGSLLLRVFVYATPHFWNEWRNEIRLQCSFPSPSFSLTNLVPFSKKGTSDEGGAEAASVFAWGFLEFQMTPKSTEKQREPMCPNMQEPSQRHTCHSEYAIAADKSWLKVSVVRIVFHQQACGKHSHYQCLDMFVATVEYWLGTVLSQLSTHLLVSSSQ